MIRTLLLTGAAIAAYPFAPGVQPLVKELPVVGEFLSESCELSVVAAFAGVFVIGQRDTADFGYRPYERLRDKGT